MRPFFYFVIPRTARNDNFTRHGSIKTETALNVEVLASMFVRRKKPARESGLDVFGKDNLSFVNV
jgi:hypothetical protein